jgi:hypothetical protein
VVFLAIKVLSPVIALMINVIFQILFLRYVPKKGLLKTVFLGFACGYLFLLVLHTFVFLCLTNSLADALCTFIANSLIYAALGYCYFHFVNLGETARRIRILRELYDSENKALSLVEILERYNAKDIVEVRLNRLLGSGQVIFDKKRYYIGKPVVLLMAKIMMMIKFILIGKKSIDF